MTTTTPEADSEGVMGPPLVFDRESVQAVDREAVERFGVPGIVLMENAARGLLAAAVDMTGDGPVLIVCGPGNNGGDGYALARHLHNHGVPVTIAAFAEPRSGTDAAVNREICVRMEIPETSAMHEAALVVDAILGTGLDRPVRGAAAEWIDHINTQDAPVLAVDLPSGLDCDTGEILGTAVRADRTATMVGWKQGFLAPEAGNLTGEIVVVDIGAPRQLVERHGRSM